MEVSACMKIYKHIFFCGLLICLSACGNNSKQSEDAVEDNTVDVAIREVRYEYGIPIDSFRVEEGQIEQGQTLGKLFQQLGATPQQTNQLNTIDNTVFDARSIRAGKQYLALYNNDSVFSYFIYLPSLTESIVIHIKDSIHVEKQVKEITKVRKVADVTIESSLWNALVNNGLDYNLAITLSDIYAWTIDFFGLQPNDRVRFMYDEMFVDSTSIGTGMIYAASFIHSRDTLQAYYYEYGDNKGYYNEKGESLRKAFLKAPLNYRRISSHFTYHRMHPIFKTVRAHTGVDYAAPLGTPVVSIGDGTVIEKGYKGGGGNTVKIRHNSTYTTAYLHLSKYGKINVGQRVSQGDVIGYVGSTGNSTGPHLDFRVWKNGTPVDPLKLESPKADPVPDSQMADFEQHIDSMKSVRF